MVDGSRLTLDSFRRLHPWPERFSALGRPREWLWHFDVPGSPADVWPFVGDTGRTNRATGLAEMHYKEVDGQLVGWHSTAGLRHEFVEHWEWVAGSIIELTREYRSGFVRLFRNIYRFDPAPDGRSTHLSVYFGWIPRGALGPLALRVGMRFFERKYRALIARLTAEVGKRRPAEVMHQPGPALDGDRKRRIAALRRELRERGVDAHALDRLIELAISGDDLELDRIRVRRLAREWCIDELLVTRAALHATRAGLLQLTWDVLCPHCRGVREKLTSLGDIPETASCEVCAVEFGTEGANAIEVTFRVHPSIRQVPDVVYCSAQPMQRSHVRLQQELAPGEARDLATQLTPGRYRLRQRGVESIGVLDVVAGLPIGERVAWTSTGPPPGGECGPQPVLALSAGEGAEPSVFAVEELEWDTDVLQPAHLFNLQDFRDLFGAEYLAAGVRLFVGEQTILFSDIVGSTRFYAEAGDPVAFSEVRKHFAQVYEAVTSAGGAVVKTIGDAVMASFSNPVDSIRAAAEIHRRFPGPGHGAETSIRLRVSIHNGPCIAVNLNSGIDYFGGTVNTAAKLQRAADAGQVALSEAVQRAPGVAEALTRLGGAVREGLVEHEALGRLRVGVWTPPIEATAAPLERTATR